MDMQWIQIKVTGKVEDLEIISAVMSMVDNSLFIEDFSDVTTDGMYGALLDESLLNADKTKAAASVFIPETRSVVEAKMFIEGQLNAEGIEYTLETVGCREEDWAESWKKYYHPIKVGKIVVVPAWEEYTPAEGEITVTMDPGMAFGTGTHETTRLVMLMMQDEELMGKRFLDMGTGSGILSICASKLGAKSCNAYDIDPVAVKVAAENAKDGGCGNITVGVSDLLYGVDLSEGKYDFCVANIVADVIIRMLPDLDKYVKSDAPIILSGIITMRKDDVMKEIERTGYKVVRELKENDWLAIMIKKDI